MIEKPKKHLCNGQQADSNKNVCFVRRLFK